MFRLQLKYALILFLGISLAITGCTEDTSPVVPEIEPQPGSRVIWVPDDYEKIQDAIWHSEDGDIIMVRRGEYHEQLQMFDKNVSLVSESGPEETIINGTGYWAFLWITGGQDTNMVVRGFTFLNNSDFQCYCLSIGGASPVIENNIFTIPMVETGYAIISGQNAAIIRNNLFFNMRGSGDMASCWGGFYNNIVLDVYKVMHNAQGHGQPLIPDYNLFWDYEELYSGAPMEWGENNIVDQEPLFEENGYRLQEGSPGIDAGRPDLLDKDGSRSDIGVYGGPYAYPIPNN